MIIKVCGINHDDNLKDLLAIPVDMIGFNFYPLSSRFLDHIPKVEPDHKHIKKTGIFVNASMAEIIQKVKDYNLNLVQLHGDESPEFCMELCSIIPVIKAISIESESDIQKAMKYTMANYILFDTKTSEFGGSGIKFKWDWIQTYEGKIPFLLAGGIGPEDVYQISVLKHPKFYGVDINSRFEISPGIKDVSKVLKFTEFLKGLKKMNL
ncbi:MAG TPA: phosphoribosylanthranilate isomerase [Saprospiraceae bacterium]|nr:phosphoribosylanthranilate isomerase [Saprospiraceae bacterium]